MGHQEKGYELVKEFVEGELDDYCIKIKDISFSEEYGGDYYFDVTVELNNDIEKGLTFKYVPEPEKDTYRTRSNLEVCLYEDCYEEVECYDWRVKYFWMALLKWEV